MSEDPGRVPDTLSTITQLPEPKPGEWEPRTRRARANVRSERAKTPAPVEPGEAVFRIIPDSKTIRAWAVGRKYDVAEKGPIPDRIQAAFNEWFKLNGLWTVKVISLQPPGATEPSGFFQVREGQVIHKQVTDEFYVKRELGKEIFGLLTPPPLPGKKK